MAHRLATAALLFACALLCSASGDPSQPAPAPVAPHPVFIQHDITYSKPDGVALKFDLALPPDGAGPFPVVVCIHGGAWRVGDKSKLDPLIIQLAEHGYAAVSVNYRLLPKYHFPAQLDDARAAVEFLRAHAAEYHLDPTRVGACGESAGAQLALLLGLMEDLPEATPGHPLVKVQCVVSYDAPTDLAHFTVPALTQFILEKRFHISIAQALGELVEPGDQAAELKAASPLTYVGKNDSPVLTFHGTLDPIVPIEQAKRLHAALQAAGVPQVLVPIEGGMHCNWRGPQREQTDRQAMEFLDKYLKPAVGSAQNPLDRDAMTNQ